MEADTKIRFRRVFEAEKSGEPDTYSEWRYAKTIGKSGHIMSSTTNASQASKFNQTEVNSVVNAKEKLYKKVEVEIF